MVVLLWIVLCVFVSFPDLFIGAHAKKQGEDLADNDGEEDEGILFGDEVSSMFLNLFGVFFTPPPPSIWMKPFGIYLYFPHYHDPKHQHSESECEWMGFGFLWVCPQKNFLNQEITDTTQKEVYLYRKAI